MGAAGYVTVYDRDELERLYKERFPEHNLTKDWWYLDTITLDLGDRRLVLDYADDQGYHTGSQNPFWFGLDEGEHFDPFGATDAQQRVLSVLREMKALGDVEVWT